MSDLSDRLRYARLSANLTLEELAKKSEISQATLQRYETGKNTPTIDKLIKLAVTLNISIDWFIGYDEPTNKFSYNTERAFILDKIYSSNNETNIEKVKLINSIINNICKLDEDTLLLLDAMIKGIVSKKNKDI